MLSMTGFGRGEALSREANIAFTAELSSVNRKQFELRFTAPSELAPLEANARKIISNYFTRGAIQLRIQFRRDQSAAGCEFNDALLNALTAKAMEIRRTHGISGEVNVETLLTAPGVMIPKSADVACPDFVNAFEAAVTAAAEACQKMRRDEGESLYRDLMLRTAELERLFGIFRERTAVMNESIRKRLLGKLEKEQLPVSTDDPSLLRELLFYTDRSDVSEELARLESHFRQLHGFLESPIPAGRSLDFLAQEFFREVTTLGNKAASPEISPSVVAFKSELEKLREQIQNVE